MLGLSSQDGCQYLETVVTARDVAGAWWEESRDAAGGGGDNDGMQKAQG